MSQGDGDFDSLRPIRGTVPLRDQGDRLTDRTDYWDYPPAPSMGQVAVSYSHQTDRRESLPPGGFVFSGLSLSLVI